MLLTVTKSMNQVMPERGIQFHVDHIQADKSTHTLLFSIVWVSPHTFRFYYVITDACFTTIGMQHHLV